MFPPTISILTFNTNLDVAFSHTTTSLARVSTTFILWTFPPSDYNFILNLLLNKFVIFIYHLAINYVKFLDYLNS